MSFNSTLNEYEMRVIEYEDGKYGIQSRRGYGQWFSNPLERYNTESDAKKKIASTTIKRICK